MILQRYFFKEIVLSTTAVSLVLLLVILSTRFVKYLASAAAGNLDTGVVFLLILYRIPDFLQLILPLGLFIALLLVYGRMYLDNEMRVLFAAGISRLHLLIMTMVPVFFIAATVALNSLWISPRALAKVGIIYHQQELRSELESLKAGQFQHFSDNSGVIYAESIGASDLTAQATPELQTTDAQSSEIQSQMKNVYIFQQEAFKKDEDFQQSDVVVFAKTGKQVVNQHGRYLVLEQGYRLKEIKEEGHFEKTEFVRYGQRIENKSRNDSVVLETDALPTAVLMKSERRDYQVAWQWRISVFLLVPIVALIAVALGKADPRQGRYFKILPAIMIYLLYLILLNVARDKLMGGKLSLELGMWWVHGLFLLVGCVLFNLERGLLTLPWPLIRNNTTTDGAMPKVRS